MTVTSKGPFRDGRIHVMGKKCSTCVFLPGNRMRLEPGRVKALLDENLAADSALQCHKTLPYAADPLPPAICRGFYDHPRSVESFPLRLGRDMGIIEFDEEVDDEA